MRFKASFDSKRQTYIIDGDTRKVFGPFNSGAVMRSLARAMVVGHLQHKFTRDVQPKDLKLYNNNDYLDAMDKEDFLSYDLKFVLDEKPIPGFGVRWIRLKLGLTQSELAERLGSSSYRTVQDWERGERNCNGPSRIALAGMFEDLLSGKIDEDPKAPKAEDASKNLTHADDN